MYLDVFGNTLLKKRVDNKQNMIYNAFIDFEKQRNLP